jgi:hypothetical protein
VSWGDGVPTYADELKEALGALRRETEAALQKRDAEIARLNERLDVARKAWMALGKHCANLPSIPVNVLDEALL